MTREEAIIKIEKIIKRANEYGEIENLLEIYIFGSFARGSKDPQDCDVLLIFESDKKLIHTKKAILLRNKFGGRISKVDMIICSSHDFNNHYPFIFKKEEFTNIWKRELKHGWKEIVRKLENEEKARNYIKPIQAKLFKMHYKTLEKVEFAFSKNIIQIKEIKALEYLNIKEEWICEEFYLDETGNVITEEFDEYKVLTDYLSYLANNKVNKAYLRTLKLMYIYAYKNNHFFEEYYNEHIKLYNKYRTHFYTDDEKILYIIYNPNFKNVFFHLKNNKKLKMIVIIPWIRIKSKENFIYEIKRGKNWRKTYVERMDKI